MSAYIKMYSFFPFYILSNIITAANNKIKQMAISNGESLIFYSITLLLKLKSMLQVLIQIELEHSPHRTPTPFPCYSYEKIYCTQQIGIMNNVIEMSYISKRT